MVKIVLKSGFEIIVHDNSSDQIKEITDVVLCKNDFLTIGDSMIRTSEIAAILETD